MDSYKWYLKTLKGYGKNMAKPKGSIGQGYQLNQVLGYIMEYIFDYITSRRM